MLGTKIKTRNIRREVGMKLGLSGHHNKYIQT